LLDLVWVGQFQRHMSESEEIELRQLATHDEFAQAVELQRVTWGAGFRDVVPAAILKVTQRVGGIAAGAFNGRGDLLGLVYGLTGFYDGRIAHWSHMLAVRPEHRDHGLGRRLKEYQRSELLAAGIEWIYWTVDPLIARNAHFNLNRLGVEVREYVPDMYGDTGSTLHAFGTDRFVVAWPVTSDRGSRIADHESRIGDHANAPVLNKSDDAALACALMQPLVRVEIPVDVEQLSLDDARAWRQSTRRALLAALENDFVVSGFVRDDDGHAYYLLPRRESAANP
jgi:predicted GNAT superfamily acetyltransferase